MEQTHHLQKMVFLADLVAVRGMNAGNTSNTTGGPNSQEIMVAIHQQPEVVVLAAAVALVVLVEMHQEVEIILAMADLDLQMPMHMEHQYCTLVAAVVDQT